MNGIKSGCEASGEPWILQANCHPKEQPSASASDLKTIE
jgi:hypothetical protein